MVIFHSYVSLPEGNYLCSYVSVYIIRLYTHTCGFVCTRPMLSLIGNREGLRRLTLLIFAVSAAYGLKKTRCHAANEAL